MHGTQTEPAAGPAAARSAPPDPAAEISLVLERLARWLRRATPAVEWNSVALSTLALLARRGPLRMTGLVGAERITQPGMTSLARRTGARGRVPGTPCLPRTDPPDAGNGHRRAVARPVAHPSAVPHRRAGGSGRPARHPRSRNDMNGADSAATMHDTAASDDTAASRDQTSAEHHCAFWVLVS